MGTLLGHGGAGRGEHRSTEQVDLGVPRRKLLPHDGNTRSRQAEEGARGWSATSQRGHVNIVYVCLDR